MNHLVIRIAIAMLSLGFLGNTNYLTLLAQQEYFNPELSGERPGMFSGPGAERLGLRDIVTPQQFSDLLWGYHPTTKEPLLRTAGREAKVLALDQVLSMPKSVSVAWALTTHAYVDDDGPAPVPSKGTPPRTRPPQSARAAYPRYRP